MDAIIDENKKSWLQRFILWREKKIKEKQFIKLSCRYFYGIGRVVLEVPGGMDQRVSDRKL